MPSLQFPLTKQEFAIRGEAGDRVQPVVKVFVRREGRRYRCSGAVLQMFIEFLHAGGRDWKYASTVERSRVRRAPTLGAFTSFIS